MGVCKGVAHNGPQCAQGVCVNEKLEKTFLLQDYHRATSKSWQGGGFPRSTNHPVAVEFELFIETLPWDV